MEPAAGLPASLNPKPYKPCVLLCWIFFAWGESGIKGSVLAYGALHGLSRA